MTETFHKFTSNLQIKEEHLDTFGHVNNAMYLQIFEQCRWDFITLNGYDLAYIHKSGFGPVILEIQISFSKELKNREHIRVESRCTDYKSKVGHIHQEMFNEKNESACEATMLFGLFDLKHRKLVTPSKEWLHAIGAELANS